MHREDPAVVFISHFSELAIYPEQEGRFPACLTYASLQSAMRTADKEAHEALQDWEYTGLVGRRSCAIAHQGRGVTSYLP